MQPWSVLNRDMWVEDLSRQRETPDDSDCVEDGEELTCRNQERNPRVSPLVPSDRSTGLTIREYSIRVITPMCGGGVESGTTDKRHPIRETSIRGHLRHWWRLTVGRILPDETAMWQREEEVFGSTEFPSPLTVRVLKCSEIESFDPSDRDIVNQFGPAAYALFAAIENKNLVSKERIIFQLECSWPKPDGLDRCRKTQNEQRRRDGKDLLPETIIPIDDELQAALSAWVALAALADEHAVVAELSILMIRRLLAGLRRSSMHKSL